MTLTLKGNLYGCIGFVFDWNGVFIDLGLGLCVKASHESLVSIRVQICQQNALSVNPFSPPGKQCKFTWHKMPK